MPNRSAAPLCFRRERTVRPHGHDQMPPLSTLLQRRKRRSASAKTSVAFTTTLAALGVQGVVVMEVMMEEVVGATGGDDEGRISTGRSLLRQVQPHPGYLSNRRVNPASTHCCAPIVCQLQLFYGGRAYCTIAGRR